MQLFKSMTGMLVGIRKAIFEHSAVFDSHMVDNMSTIVKKIKEYGERDLAKDF